ncbi:hypothetical protein E2C01_019756 [Portunus trituberculatus]|uniref:Uncharacterized protein n=1 Tax=Portunus trituberculatus TaxID=210409 RepID=A0A5B7DY44_PORTR|nr:hypothetical protein [Portunus trituberculatus]
MYQSSATDYAMIPALFYQNTGRYLVSAVFCPVSGCPLVGCFLITCWRTRASDARFDWLPL